MLSIQNISTDDNHIFFKWTSKRSYLKSSTLWTAPKTATRMQTWIQASSPSSDSKIWLRSRHAPQDIGDWWNTFSRRCRMLCSQTACKWESWMRFGHSQWKPKRCLSWLNNSVTTLFITVVVFLLDDQICRNTFSNHSTSICRNKAVLQWRWLIIDEISMISSQLLAEIDMSLRNIARRNGSRKLSAAGDVQPFGCINVRFMNDLWQLAPHRRRECKSESLMRFGHSLWGTKRCLAIAKKTFAVGFIMFVISCS